MKIRIGRLCIFTLISLLSLFGLAAPASAQDSIPRQLIGSSKVPGKPAKTHKSKLAGAPSGYDYQVLYSFCSAPNCTDGENPAGGLILDAAGNLYGTTSAGGTVIYGGTVFKLETSGHESLLYGFCPSGYPNCTDGYDPVASLIQDAAGNLYGTTTSGGASSDGFCATDGCGTVYKVDNAGHETVLYSFCSVAGCADGAGPIGGLIQDASGNLYGTTSSGGNEFGDGYTGGTAFKVDATGTETVLYNFCSAANCADGLFPLAGLIQDGASNLYGTTYGGGLGNCKTDYSNGCGTVFKVDGSGHETVLYSFNGGTDGANPESGLVRDASGNFYGTTYYGGADNYGTVFKADTAGQETVLHTFGTVTNDGAYPEAGLFQDPAGDLYGTTAFGGANGGGMVFELNSAGQYTVLYSFGCSERRNCSRCRPDPRLGGQPVWHHSVRGREL